VSGVFEIKSTDTEICWRYELSSPSETIVEQASDVIKSSLAFKTVSDLLIKNCDGVGLRFVNQEL